MNSPNYTPPGGAQATTASQSPVQGQVRFIQHNLPGLEAGEYKLEVAQTVSTQAEKPMRNQYFFAVLGERFAISSSDIDSTYPPDQSVGEYDNTLPHIALKKQTLPWLRYPTLNAPEIKYPSGQSDRDVPSWLAVLLFDEDDTIAYPGFKPQTKTVKLSDLFFQRPSPSGAQGYSYFFREAQLSPTSDPNLLAKHLDYGQQAGDRCQVIDIPIPLFFSVAPSVDDLGQLAHVRNVDITKKATQNGVPASRNDLSKIPGTSNFALVLGNRLPQKGKRTFAHLVSLEGLEPFLPIDKGDSDTLDAVVTPTQVSINPAFNIDPNGFVRLVSLASWSFSSTGNGRDFERLLLKIKPKQTDPKGPDFSIGLPSAPVIQADPDTLRKAKNALTMGYTALTHHTRDGGKTVSWFRGPLLPYPVSTAEEFPTYASADSALSFDPDTGMLDVSYSAAWQLGRLMALTDKQFSVALYNWRRTNLRGVVSVLEKNLLRLTLNNGQKRMLGNGWAFRLLDLFLPAAGDADSVDVLTSANALRADIHRTVLGDPNLIDATIKDSIALPSAINDCLAKLKLLEGVPFRYLVPDEQMLPPESLRVFHVDMNWVHALIDGSLSIGRNAAQQTDSPEYSHDVAAKPILRTSMDNQAGKLRLQALKLEEASKNTAPVGQVSGFMLRSAVVAGWPGLEVNGYASDGTLLDIIRFERLARDVLLCLFETKGKTLTKIDIHEPAEGLHFGIGDDATKTVKVRYNVASGSNGPGHQTVGVEQTVPFRSTGGQRVFRAFRLARLLNDKKYSAYIQNIPADYDHLPSSEFAMQLIKGVGLVSFILQPGSSS